MADDYLLSIPSVAELLQRHPETATVLIRHQMACVGCQLSAFHTITEAAVIYALDPELLMAELLHGMQTPGMDAPGSSK